MVRVEFGMVRDKPWFFYKNGGDKPPLTVYVVEVYGKTVKFDNGDTISADRFYEVCEPALDEEPMVADGNDLLGELENYDIDTGSDGPMNDDPINEMMGDIRFDENGVPISTGHQTQKPTQRQIPPAIHQRQQAHDKKNLHDSPLIALTEKGQTKLVKINFQMEFPTVNKTLFNALMETYPEEEIDTLLEHMINKIGIDNIKQIIKQKVLQYYKPTSKKDVTA